MTAPADPSGEVESPTTSADSTCPQCAGARYRGPFGWTCPRCLIAATVASDAAESARADASVAPEESSADHARRFGRFELSLRSDGSWWELGRGRLGVTYRAVDVESLLPVALKLIDSAEFSGPVAPPAIFQQALEVAKLQHPNIARLIHLGVRGDGRCFLASEWIDGETLEDLVQRAGPLPVSVVLEIGLQIARALEAAGERRIRHGDLNPANVLLVDTRRETRALVKVLDCGVLDWFRGRNREHQATPGYTSPELGEGRTSDARADFYALGATMYFLLSAKVPVISVDAKDQRSVSRVRFTPLRERGVPEEVLAWLRRVLDSNPAGRPRDAYDLTKSLVALRAHLKSLQAPPGSPPRAQTTRWWGRWFGGSRT